MNNLKNQIEEARDDAQHLHAKLEASTSKHHAAIRAEAVDVEAEANELARSLKTMAGGERAEVKQHLQGAGSLIEQVAQQARDLSSASDAKLKSANSAAAQKARSAVQELSQALAKKREAMRG